MINGAWNVLELAFVVYFWVETKGKTLEEIDEVSFKTVVCLRRDLLLIVKLFDGVKHSDAPDIEAILKGKVDLSNLIVEGVELQAKRGATTTVTSKDDGAKGL